MWPKGGWGRTGGDDDLKMHGFIGCEGGKGDWGELYDIERLVVVVVFWIKESLLLLFVSCIRYRHGIL